MPRTPPLFLRASLLVGLAAFGLSAGCVSNVAPLPNCADDPEAEGCVGVADGGAEELADPARIFIDPPFGVGFDCVAVGCDETRHFLLENRGGRDLAMTLARLSVETSSEFTVRMLDVSTDGEVLAQSEREMPSEEAPTVLAPGEMVGIEVRYVPDDALADEGELWIEWFDTIEDFEDAEIHREELPITTRVLGEAVAELETPVLGYGYVAVGESRELPIRVKNATTGTAVLALEPPVALEGTPGNFQVLTEDTVFVEPGATAELLVRFTPNAPDAFYGAFSIPTNDGGQPELTVVVQGTAIGDPWFELAQPTNWTVAFGDVRIGDTGEREVTIRNRGGLPLLVTPTLASGAEAGFAAEVAFDQQLPAINPLEERTFTVTVAPAQGGDLLGRIDFATNDPTLPNDYVDLAAYGIAPDAAFSPAALDFGTLVQSWTSPAQTVTISNQGTGELTIEALEFDVGSSSMVRLVEPAMLPVKLSGDDTLDIALYVEGNTLGPANATLLVYTDSVEDPVRRVEITAQVVTCEAGCPVDNGIPNCSSGSCQVGNCLAGWHNPDQTYSTGCECPEDSSGEIGGTCASGVQVGTLYDDDSPKSVTRSGTLHSVDDVDLYYFRAYDTSEILSDSYRAAVYLQNAPPGLQVCARFTDWGGGCGGENQASCSTNRVRGGGNGVGDDSEDVTVWVRWADGAAPMCGSYTIVMRADDD